MVRIVRILVTVGVRIVTEKVHKRLVLRYYCFNITQEILNWLLINVLGQISIMFLKLMYKYPPHIHIKKKIILRFLQIVWEISRWRIFPKYTLYILWIKYKFHSEGKKIKKLRRTYFYCASRLWASFPFLQDWEKRFFPRSFPLSS